MAVELFGFPRATPRSRPKPAAGWRSACSRVSRADESDHVVSHRLPHALDPNWVIHKLTGDALVLASIVANVARASRSW